MMRMGGMVLLTTVVMILLIASMVLSMMHAMLSFSVSVQQLEQHDDVEVALDKVARQLISRLTSASTWPCKRESEDMRVGACQWREDKHTYDYWVTDLGSFPCLILVDHEHKQGSHHWLLDIKSRDHKRMLRVRIAVPDIHLPCDLPRHALISSGVLSWSMSSR